jgi:hypothetical protein
MRQLLYTDVFDKERMTTFRLIYGGPPPVDGKHFKPDSDGNEMT